MFIKHGDGKIVNIIKNDEDLTEEQKKLALELSKKQLQKNSVEENKKLDNNT